MENIHKSWKPLFDKYNFNLDIRYSKEDIVYPPKEMVFRVFEMDVKDIIIVLVGQDCYHGKGQAHGLSFSVPDGVKIPPSLRNIFKELDLSFPEREYKFNSGNLEKWFYREKIFLLNSSLTVIEGKPGSDMKIWEKFTNDVIKFISDNNDKCVFLLLGNYARNKDNFIKDDQNVVYAPHPSPLARGFIDSCVFLEIERRVGRVIDWSI
jgi:uracil-DNA glycosylase